MSKQVCITVRTLKSEFYSNQFSFDDNLKASDVAEGSVKRSQDSIETRSGIIIRCVPTSEIWGTTQTIEISAACFLSLSVILYLAILSLYYHHCLNYISYSKDLQSQSSQSLPPANPSPKEEMQPTRNEKSLSIIRICWHMTVPWHFNFW